MCGIELGPTFTVSSFALMMFIISKDLSWSGKIDVVTPVYPPPPIVLTESVVAETNV